MTSLLLFVLLIVAMPLGLRYPLIAAVVYIWLSTAYPHAGALGMYDQSWVLIAAIVLVLSILFNRPREFSLRSPIIVVVGIFFLWTMLTTAIGPLYPEIARGLAFEFAKVFAAFLLVSSLMNTRTNLNYFSWVLIFAAGSTAISGMLQLVLTGGSSMVMGPPGSPYFPNNEAARVIGVSALPFAVFQGFHANSKLMRWIAFGIAAASVLAIIGTSSRGAFVALVALLGYWWIISKRKILMSIVGVMGIVAVALLMTGANQDRFVDRVESIQDRKADNSYLGRVFAWQYAENLAAENPILGGGFGAFRGAVMDNGRWKDAHSAYYEALGEHGYVGLGLYLLVLVTGGVVAVRLRRKFSRNKDFYWERDLAIATQLSLVFFVVGAITGSSTYGEYLFFTLAMISGLSVRARRAGSELGKPAFFATKLPSGRRGPQEDSAPALAKTVRKGRRSQPA